MTDQLSLRLEPGLPRLPISIRPMLARSVEAPFDSADHLFEPSWSGERALAFVETDDEAPPGRGRELRLLDRRGRNLAPLAPDLASIASHVAARSAVLDGELVVVDRTGRADPDGLARRLGGAVGPPFAYLVFDLLYLDGRSLLGEPLERRRQTLRRVLHAGGAVVAVPAIASEGRALHAAATAQGIAGVMARHRRSPYLPGVRSRLWRFVPSGPAGSTRAGFEDAEVEATPAGPVLALISRLPLDED
jgi:ATP-dependent DNA ligase